MQRTTMGDLASWEPSPGDEEQYSRFVSILDEFYPEDWRSWEVNEVSYEDLFGAKITSDDECRLRFAIPTVHLAHAFAKRGTNPSLSERKYKEIKRKLLTWPLGRAIIYNPLSTMKMIHPVEAFNRFHEMLPNLKSKLISRTEASTILRSRDTPETSHVSSIVSPSSRKRQLEEENSFSPPRKVAKPSTVEDDTLANYMKRQNVILEKLYELSFNQNASLKQIQDNISKKEEGPASPRSSEFDKREEDNSSIHSDSWVAPDYDELGMNEDLNPEELLDFAPETKESEAKISTADEALLKQGIDCQRLGNESWQNIRYAEVQKKFQATPVFTNLKVNSNLAMVTPPWQMVLILEKMDLCLGAITNGLLQQRKEFQDIYNKSSLEIKAHISKHFLSTESPFRKTSDALLQYTCGKRAEILQQRRSLYKPSNKALSELLHSIPPSSTHLFSEPQLSDLVKEQGGIGKLFPSKSKNTATNFRPKNTAKDNFRRHETKEKPRVPDHFRKSTYKYSDRSAARQGGKRSYTNKQRKSRAETKKF